MNAVWKILIKVGEYIYRNSVWMIPVVETVYKSVKKIIRRKKNERTIENQNQIGFGKD